MKDEPLPPDELAGLLWAALSDCADQKAQAARVKRSWGSSLRVFEDLLSELALEITEPAAQKAVALCKTALPGSRERQDEFVMHCPKVQGLI